MGIVEQFLLQLKNEKRRWRRAVAILTVLSLVVATVVSWNLRMTGVTMANGASCGQQEHLHTEECQPEKVLICGFDTKSDEIVPLSTPEAEPEVEPEAEPEVEPEAEPEIEPEVEPVVEPEVEPEVEPVIEPEVEPEIEPEVEPEIEPEVEPGVEPEVEP
ncbi:MAG: hypothetical protein J6Q16_04570, partial [Clostridia bacterium]|nr:hypothetical protein [Clostridia bacterium]